METKYNGWTNYPTWCINLWLNNDEPLYRQACEITQATSSVGKLADQLKEWVESLAPELERAGMVSDLLGWAFSIADWHEIAASWWEDRQDNS
jgi:hypothetical protein